MLWQKQFSKSLLIYDNETFFKKKHSKALLFSNATVSDIGHRQLPS